MATAATEDEAGTTKDGKHSRRHQIEQNTHRTHLCTPCIPTTTYTNSSKWINDFSKNAANQMKYGTTHMATVTTKQQTHMDTSTSKISKRDVHAAFHLHVSPQPTVTEYATQNYQILIIAAILQQDKQQDNNKIYRQRRIGNGKKKQNQFFNLMKPHPRRQK